MSETFALVHRVVCLMASVAPECQRRLARLGHPARGALALVRWPRRHRVVHRSVGVGEVDDRRRPARAPARRRGAGLLARRRQPPPRAQRRPRLRRRRPHGERPPGRRGRPALRGRRIRVGGPRHQPLPGGSGPRPGDPRGGGPGVLRGLRRHAPRRVRGPRSEGALRQGPGGGAARLHRPTPAEGVAAILEVMVAAGAVPESVRAVRPGAEPR